jgi:hypothetical protein
MENVAQKVAPEEKPIIENIISLFNQLLQMQDSGPVVDEVVTEALGEDAKMEEVDVAKSAEGETGDDKAETRLEEVTPTTDHSLSELKKSIDALSASFNNRAVKKAVPANGNEQALTLIAKALSGLVEKQNSQDMLNTQLFEALGVTDEVMKSVTNDVQKDTNDKPVQGNDIALFAKEFASQIQKAMGANEQVNPDARNSWNDKKTVRKGLFDVAQALHNGQKIGG